MYNTYKLGDLFEHPNTGCIWSISEINYETNVFRIKLIEQYKSSRRSMFNKDATQICRFDTMDNLLKDSSPVYGWKRYQPNFEIET